MVAMKPPLMVVMSMAMASTGLVERIGLELHLAGANDHPPRLLHHLLLRLGFGLRGGLGGGNPRAAALASFGIVGQLVGHLSSGGKAGGGVGKIRRTGPACCPGRRLFADNPGQLRTMSPASLPCHPTSFGRSFAMSSRSDHVLDFVVDFITGGVRPLGPALNLIRGVFPEELALGASRP